MDTPPDRRNGPLQGDRVSGSEQEFDGRPVLWAFRRFYSIFDLCCSRLRGGGVQSRSSDGNRDIDAVVSDSF
jgi:hypothetical protein